MNWSRIWYFYKMKIFSKWWWMIREIHSKNKWNFVLMKKIFFCSSKFWIPKEYILGSIPVLWWWNCRNEVNFFRKDHLRDFLNPWSFKVLIIQLVTSKSHSFWILWWSQEKKLTCLKSCSWVFVSQDEVLDLL